MARVSTHLQRVLSLVLLILNASALLAQSLNSSFGVPGINASYDYVIVGGGTAGLTIAAQLAENSTNSVAVIEAGGFYEIVNGNISVIPGEATFYAGTDPDDTQPLVDWGFDTLPQEVVFLIELETSQLNDSTGCKWSNYALCAGKDAGWLFRTEFHGIPQVNRTAIYHHKS